MTDVFISYARKNKEFADKIVEGLRQRERKIWIDWHDIRASELWRQAIFRASMALYRVFLY